MPRQGRSAAVTGEVDQDLVGLEAVARRWPRWHGRRRCSSAIDFVGGRTPGQDHRTAKDRVRLRRTEMERGRPPRFGPQARERIAGSPRPRRRGGPIAETDTFPDDRPVEARTRRGPERSSGRTTNRNRRPRRTGLRLQGRASGDVESQMRGCRWRRLPQEEFGGPSRRGREGPSHPWREGRAGWCLSEVQVGAHAGHRDPGAGRARHTRAVTIRSAPPAVIPLVEPLETTPEQRWSSSTPPRWPPPPGRSRDRRAPHRVDQPR